jgi:quercetin dioxygenase-like cupin family protein
VVLSSVTGRLQEVARSLPAEEIRLGHVIWFSPREKYWHGVTATSAMTHIAIVEQLDGKSADWMEQVNEEQYKAWSVR